jgi:hypothetical protein
MPLKTIRPWLLWRSVQVRRVPLLPCPDSYHSWYVHRGPRHHHQLSPVMMLDLLVHWLLCID